MIRWDFLYTLNSQFIPQNKNKSLSYCTTIVVLILALVDITATLMRMKKEYGRMFLCSLLYLMKKLYFGKVINIITMQNYSGILPVVIVFFLQ